jgi:hypothetical protein
MRGGMRKYPELTENEAFLKKLIQNEQLNEETLIERKNKILEILKSKCHGCDEEDIIKNLDATILSNYAELKVANPAFEKEIRAEYIDNMRLKIYLELLEKAEEGGIVESDF